MLSQKLAIPLSIFSVTLLFLLSFTDKAVAIDNNFSIGGTDYVIYDQGDGIKYPNQMKLEYPKSIKSVIGSYDLNPGTVRDQLQTMCHVGQRKISLIVYFLPYYPEWKLDQNSVFISDMLPVINSYGGKLSPRQEKNVKDVVSLIAGLKTTQNTPCFNELQFRFAPMGDAQPLGWAAWDEVRYQENWNLVYHTHNLIKTVTENTSLIVYFDIGAEQGGQVVGPAGGTQNVPYIKRLLADYHATFGINDTYGFSIAWAPGRFQNLIEAYDQVGIRPNYHAVDIYDEGGVGMKPQLEALYKEMKAAGEQNKPLTIQETYYNDVLAYDQILAAKNQLGINIHTIMQWQMVRGDLTTWNIGQLYPHMTLPVAVLSPIPNCSNLSGPTEIILGKEGKYTADFFSPQGNLDTKISIGQNGKFLEDINGSVSYQSSNTATGTFTWIPKTTGTFDVFCRAWNDGIAECRGNAAYVDGLPRYQCAGPKAFMTVNVIARFLPGNLNKDSTINIFDYNELVSKWGRPYTNLDYQNILTNFGK